MTIGMFSSTMPMFLTFLVNKLYKKWRKLFKFGGDKSLINLRILNLLVQLCVDVKSFLKVVDWGSFFNIHFWKTSCAQHAAECTAACMKKLLCAKSNLRPLPHSLHTFRHSCSISFYLLLPTYLWVRFRSFS